MQRRTKLRVHGGRRFEVPPRVFDPVRHLSGVALADHITGRIPNDSRVLEIGTGCGIVAAQIARRASCVVATDIDPVAVECAQRNLAGLRVDVRLGDLFEPVVDERFDLLVSNPPYDVGVGDATVTSPDLLRRLASGWETHARSLVVGFPADQGDVLAAAGFDLCLWRIVPTAGLPLGIFVTDGPPIRDAKRK